MPRERRNNNFETFSAFDVLCSRFGSRCTVPAATRAIRVHIALAIQKHFSSERSVIGQFRKVFEVLSQVRDEVGCHPCIAKMWGLVKSCACARSRLQIEGHGASVSEPRAAMAPLLCHTSMDRLSFGSMGVACLQTRQGPQRPLSPLGRSNAAWDGRTIIPARTVRQMTAFGQLHGLCNTP